MSTTLLELPFSVLKHLTVRQLLTQCLLIVSALKQLEVFFFKVVFDREQLVGLRVTEKNANTFETEEFGELLAALEDEVGVGALCADGTRDLNRLYHFPFRFLLVKMRHDLVQLHLK